MGYLVGRGVADITGEAAEVGMLGYGMKHQQTEGIHLRLRARAFIVADTGTPARRILLVVCDLPLMFDGVRKAVLARLAESFGDRYGERNTMLTVTHTHCGTGGYSHDWLYNTTTGGFRPNTFASLVDGIVEAVGRADADVAPARLLLAHGELRNASVNRARTAFERNPPADRAFFPDGVDPQSTVLTIERDGSAVGAINWFATHNTSMTNRNRLISSDNKGYAAYAWERLEHGQDYRTGGSAGGLGFIAAFAQTNAGDMSPNLELKPGRGPTQDEFENTKIIGTRQFEAAATLVAGAESELSGGLDFALTYVDLGDCSVRPEFTGDGREHRTSGPKAGASAFAGKWADGPAFPGFREGRNPVFDLFSRHVLYRLSRRLRESHAPKGLVLPAALVHRRYPVAQQHAAVQLIRIGSLYLVGIPGEVTIVAGLRIRRAVAAIVGAEVRDVLLAGYSNGYVHYVTTPEEYDEQLYEGGSTMFGRWELPALVQAATAVAGAMAAGRDIELGVPEPDRAGRARPTKRRIPPDEAAAGRRVGEVVTEPRERYGFGDTVRVEFAGAHPGNEVRRGGTFVEVQRLDEDSTWRTVLDDGDWDTKFSWKRTGRGTSTVTISWTITTSVGAVTPGRYRIRYLGDAKAADGTVAAFVGTSTEFEVTTSQRANA